MRKMKDSRIEWIGVIPDDWKIQRLKAVLCERNESNNPIRTNFILSLTNDRGVIPYTEKGEIGNKSKDDLTGYKLAYPGDIVLNSMNVIIGSVALSSYYGCISPVYYMLYPRFSDNLVEFYNYLFQTKELQSKLKGYGNGIMEIRMRIQMSKLNTLELPVPPEKIQYKIVKFLNTKCTKIDTIIAKQQEVIKKLKEYKKSVITETVTKGLNPDVPMKDSGMKGIGEIPKSWNVIISRFVINQIADVDHFMPQSVEKGYPYVMTGDLSEKASNIKFTECRQITKEAYQDLARKIKPMLGDVILARYATIGTACYVDIEKEFLVSYSCVTIRPNVKVLEGKYLFWFLKSKVFTEEAMQFVNSNTQENIGIEGLFKVKIIIPPIEEQNAIADFLDCKCSIIDSVIEKKQIIINKLTSYKKSLIYEAATGKKEV